MSSACCFGCFKGVSKPVQVLLNSIDGIVKPVVYNYRLVEFNELLQGRVACCYFGLLGFPGKGVES